MSFPVKLTPIQLMTLSFIPMVLLLAQISSWVSPDEIIHNYYTSRGNLINTWFVKKGWFWTTLAYIAVVWKSPKFKRRSLYRFGLITFSWLLFTQWLNGMPLMDRIFVWTGGECRVETPDRIPISVKHLFEKSLDSDYHVSKVVSSMVCRSSKGKWEGGHDPSGHVFLMTLSICVLVTELLAIYNLQEIKEEFNNILKDKSVLKNPSVLLISIVLLSSMMLYMTGLKYHSSLEQFSGLFVSYSVLLFVWWLVPDN